ncbi:MAG: sodium/proline symporter, partial [Pseudomonadota bacterium]
MSATLAVFLAYLVILAGLALWSRKDSGSLSGYYLAGRKLPSWAVAFSTNATGESGWLLLGLTGMGYAVGAQAYWVLVGEALGVALAWVLVSRRLKRLSDETNAVTVPDVLSARFNDKANILRLISVAIILAMVGVYVSAQMTASGKAFSSFIGLDYKQGAILGAAVIIAYTFVGGFKAVAYTDVLQGVLMLAGLIAVPAFAIDAAGGW